MAKCDLTIRTPTQTLCLKLERIDLSYSAGKDCGGDRRVVKIRRLNTDLRAAFARAVRKVVASGRLSVRGNPLTITLPRTGKGGTTK